MHLYSSIVDEAANRAKAIISSQFHVVRGALIQESLRPETIRALRNADAGILGIDKDRLAIAARNIGRTTTRERLDRGLVRDALFTLFKGGQRRERTAMLFTHEIIVNNMVKLTDSEDRSVYPAELNRLFALIVAFGQYRGKAFAMAMETRNFVISDSLNAAAGRFQRFLDQGTPEHYDNVFTRGIVAHFKAHPPAA